MYNVSKSEFNIKTYYPVICCCHLSSIFIKYLFTYYYRSWLCLGDIIAFWEVPFQAGILPYSYLTTDCGRTDGVMLERTSNQVHDVDPTTLVMIPMVSNLNVNFVGMVGVIPDGCTIFYYTVYCGKSSCGQCVSCEGPFVEFLWSLFLRSSFRFLCGAISDEVFGVYKFTGTSVLYTLKRNEANTDCCSRPFLIVFSLLALLFRATTIPLCTRDGLLEFDDWFPLSKPCHRAKWDRQGCSRF